jgi:3-deoxy-7-phosphoheptulonate synthase
VAVPGQELFTRVATALGADEWRRWWELPAAQQPDWGDQWLVGKVRSDLAGMPPLVERAEVDRLRELLADVATGHRQVVQAGDCAEDPEDCVPAVLSRKVGLLAAVAGVMRARTGRPTLLAGRIAGQFAKPRSNDTVRHGEIELPAYRGHLVNGPEPELGARRPDPLRMPACYRAAHAAVTYLRDESGPHGDPAVWTSHEALLLDYEVPLVRRDEHGALWLASTHWPWIGERTRDVGGAHVDLLARVDNPVACKLGSRTTVEQVLGLCARLDPDRTPGRLTFIARFGAGQAVRHLPRLVAAVRAAGHPVIWLCDPMHGNTVRGPRGRKVRFVETMVMEVREFQEAVRAAGGVPGGLHLEATHEDVDECVPDEKGMHSMDDERYRTLCDPRLNHEQALAVAAEWGWA